MGFDHVAPSSHRGRVVESADGLGLSCAGGANVSVERAVDPGGSFDDGTPPSRLPSAQSGRIAGSEQTAEANAGAQEPLRIDRVAVDARLVMQMWPGRTAGRADLADHLANADVLSDLHVDLRQVP